MRHLHPLIFERWMSRRRARLVELLLLTPAAALLAAGMHIWSEYFWLGARLQDTVERAAAAAAPARDEADAERLARDVVAREAAHSRLEPAALLVFLERRPGVLMLRLAYEVPKSGPRLLAGLLPSPPATIVRAVRVHVAPR